MFNLETLNTLIAVVIIILILSLIVESVQALLKKLLKLKSRQIEESLIDLFENALNAPGERVRGGWLREFWRYITSFVVYREVPRPSSPAVRELYVKVAEKFQGLGRAGQLDRPMFNSLSKEDLMKVLRKVAPGALVSDFEAKINLARLRVSELRGAMSDLDAGVLGGDARFATLREEITPFLNDAQRVLTTGEPRATDLMIENLIDLRRINFGAALRVLGELQERVEADIESGKAAARGADAKELRAAAGQLQTMSRSIGGLSQEFDAIVTPLRASLGEIENWYDTVMHSFDERYNRSMKTWAFILGLLVAVVLNANAINIYRDVSTNSALRDSVLQSREEVLNRYEARLAEENLNQLQAGGTERPTDLSCGDADQLGRAGAAPLTTLQKLHLTVCDTRAEMRKDAELYARFGFKPLGGELRGKTLIESAEYMLLSVPGWLLMAALLSLGAPFWHDALESLFGLKNLLRKKGDIRNVEDEAGAGQPQT